MNVSATTSWILLGGWLAAAAPAYAALPQSACRVCKIPLSEGMERRDVEEKVAAALGKENHYAPYGDKLKGGLVSYVDGKWILRVTYSQGSPAPWVINAAGVGEHMKPVDSTVLKYELVKAIRPARD
jgi:hypothetical protein